MVLGSWIAIFVSASGTLMHNGINSLKYFTVLSNLFEGAASVIWLMLGIYSFIRYNRNGNDLDK